MDHTGHSYLAGIDLVKDDYCKLWKSLKSTRGVLRVIREMEAKEASAIQSLLSRLDAQPATLSL